MLGESISWIGSKSVNRWYGMVQNGSKPSPNDVKSGNMGEMQSSAAGEAIVSRNPHEIRT